MIGKGLEINQDKFAGKDDPLSEVIDYWKRGNIVNGPKFSREAAMDVLKTDENGQAEDKYFEGNWLAIGMVVTGEVSIPVN